MFDAHKFLSYLTGSRVITDAVMPLNLMLAIAHSVFVKGAALHYEIDGSIGVEATHLYPEIAYTTVDEYLNQFI